MTPTEIRQRMDERARDVAQQVRDLGAEERAAYHDLWVWAVVLLAACGTFLTGLLLLAWRLGGV